jgi:hypothetical protein
MMRTLQWHGANDVLEVAGLRLQDPLVYSATASASAEQSAILLHKHTNRAADGPSSSHHGFPGYNSSESYEHIGPASRLGYLKWLQQGRAMPCDERYLMLFLKGLERRVLIDRNDAPLIWNEVWRLWRGTGDSQYSFQHVSQQFLWFLLPHVADVATMEQVDALAGKMYRINEWNDHAKRHLSLFLWWSARKSGQLSAWAAYRCAHVLEGTRHTVVLERAEEEMRRLFEIRFRERWGATLPLRLPEKARQRLVYQPQNYSLRPTAITWPDPLKMPSHWNPLAEELVHLYNRCQEELRPLGTATGQSLDH